MATKKFSDFEKQYLEELKKKTFGEILKEFRQSEWATAFDGENTIMELKDTSIFLEDAFYKFVFKQEEFLALPILASAYDEYSDSYIFALEEMEDGVFEALEISGSSVTVTYANMADLKKVKLPYKTIRDLAENPTWDMDVSDYL